MKHAHNQGPQMVMIGTALSMASMVLATGVAGSRQWLVRGNGNGGDGQ